MRGKQSNTISSEVLLAEYEAVYHYALTLSQNEAEAQDIVQETFLKAMQAKDSFKGNSSLYTWLCTIAKNLWYNKCKKRNREVSQEELLPDLPSGEKSTDAMLIDKDMARQVHRILHTMEEPYKEVFSLRIFGELSFGEIADLFGKTESWARVTHHRAKKSIVEQLKKEGILE